ncbi:MAG: IS30 family transposase [Thermotogota bacterium]|nr:IS30 family transposase [Thermotogota bacterium]
MEEKKYKRLSLTERVIIQTLLEEHKTKSFISEKLKRARSTITREINKWVQHPGETYNAELAHWNAEDDYLNKRNLDKIGTYNRLKFYVYKGLLNEWSPEQISGRIKDDYPNDPVMSISHEAIYMHIYAHPQARLNRKLIALLPYHKSRRRKIDRTKKRKTRIKDQTSIDQRPKYIEDRLEIGHWEGDLMIGVGQKSAIGTLVERKARFTYIIKLKNRRSETVVKGFSKKLNNLDSIFTKTMTYDNGLEMAKHKLLTKKTGIKVYFAHPYSSWERGTNENTNGLIRRYFPKGTDFNNVTEEQLKIVQDKLNNRPRKVLGFKTPNEIMAQEYS